MPRDAFPGYHPLTYHAPNLVNLVPGVPIHAPGGGTVQASVAGYQMGPGGSLSYQGQGGQSPVMHLGAPAAQPASTAMIPGVTGSAGSLGPMFGPNGLPLRPPQNAQEAVQFQFQAAQYAQNMNMEMLKNAISTLRYGIGMAGHSSPFGLGAMMSPLLGQEANSYMNMQFVQPDYSAFFDQNDTSGASPQSYVPQNQLMGPSSWQMGQGSEHNPGNLAAPAAPAGSPAGLLSGAAAGANLGTQYGGYSSVLSGAAQGYLGSLMGGNAWDWLDQIQGGSSPYGNPPQGNASLEEELGYSLGAGLK
jgi:hypothetical protein